MLGGEVGLGREDAAIGSLFAATGVCWTDAARAGLSGHLAVFGGGALAGAFTGWTGT